MKTLQDKLKSNPIVYVTRDIERALGISPDTEGYFIISNNTDFAKQTAAGRKNILLMPGTEIKSTADILQSDSAKQFINKIKNPSILVFKNTSQVEKICADNGWKLLNPPSAVAGEIEAKISQVKIFQSLGDLFLKYEIAKCKDIQWPACAGRPGNKFILQFNYSHTGSGTILIDEEKKLAEIKAKFPEREARISDFVVGPLFTNNNALGNGLLMGNISYQITGLPYFTDGIFSTIGNDWGLAQRILTPGNLKQFKSIVESVAAELKKLNWKGLFGVDVILDEKTDKMRLIEVNARQPASTTFESVLQDKIKGGINIFEAHLAGLLGLDLSAEKLKAIAGGSQIIKRICKNENFTDKTEKIKKIKATGCEVISYNNEKPDSELLRIQSEKSFMDGHNKLSELGAAILNIIHPNDLSLSQDAQAAVDSYLNLKIGNNIISVPYFNNARIKTRGGLKVYTGKGDIKEIEEEISILEKKQKIDLSAMNKEDAKKFLVDNNIGIDCSGFAYYVLDAESRSRTNLSLRAVIKFPEIKSFLRKIIAKLRVTQNVNVLTFCQNANSRPVSLKDARPGDFIAILNSGPKNDRNHIIIITDISGTAHKKIHYVHSFAWSADGKYNHGVRKGEIEIINENAGLLAQKWTEQGLSGEENETFTRARQAEVLELRRLSGSL